MNVATADELRSTVDRAVPRLLAMPDADTARRPAPGKWSPREIVGHLIDSASNNHQRFVRAPFQDDLVFTGYDQDAWVSTQQYQDEPWRDLVTLWQLFNVHLAHVMETMPAGVRSRVHTRHNLDRLAWQPVAPGAPTTLDDFMRDYVGHLKHHLRQLGIAE